MAAANSGFFIIQTFVINDTNTLRVSWEAYFLPKDSREYRAFNGFEKKS